MDIKVIVRGKSSKHENVNDIQEEIVLENDHVINMAISEVLKKYSNIVIDKDDCYIDGISSI
jgi:hypothetical protein